MTDYRDQRKESRELVVEFTLVYDSKKGKLLGYLRDLTLSGAQISGSKKLAVRTDVALSIEIPKELPGVNEKELHIKAKVARCITVTDEPPGYALGFKFVEATLKQKKIIEKMLKRYHFQRNWVH